jgi:ribonuclease G
MAPRKWKCIPAQNEIELHGIEEFVPRRFHWCWQRSCPDSPDVFFCVPVSKPETSMSKELFVSSTPHETKVAVVEDDQLSEIYFERENEYTLAGSIYKGRVTRVLPGMQSAFVNIGLERDAFLYVSDFLLEEEDTDGLEQAVTRSRPLITEPAEEQAAASSMPIEAEEIIPPAEVAGEEDAGGEESSAASRESGDQEGEREGARKWKGRRRRRGRGGRFQDREDGGERPAREEAQASRPEHGNGSHGQHAEAAPSESGQPQARHETPAHSPVVLPGESISKYQPQGSTPAREEKQATRVPRPSVRPSTEYALNPADFTPGSMVLPGESISKYRHRQTARPSAVAEQHEGSMQEAQVEEETYHHDVPEPEIQEHHDESSSAAALTAPAENEQPVEHEEQRSAQEAYAEQEQRFEGMNVAAAFGGAETETEDEIQEEVQQPAQHAAHERVQESAGTHEEIAQEEQQQQTTQQTEVTEQHPWRAPASGVFEEETIEEEESELATYEDSLDLGDFEELEEEVLGTGHEQYVAMGGELTDAVRDAHINERATGQYEAEGLDEGAEETDEEETGHSGDFGDFDEEDAEPGEGFEQSEHSEENLEGARAEHRAGSGTAGYQQQQRSDRRGDRRGGGRRPGRRMRGRRFQQPRQLPAISDLLKEGQEIVVQIAKEPIAKKGARITSHIALPGRFLVYMPTVHHTGVSRKIASEEERHRLKRIVLSERGESSGGFIVRTAASGASEEDLRADIRFLINLWNEIRQRSEKSKAPALIYHDLNLVERILRDQVTTGFSTIWVDTEQEYERILRFVSRFQPSLLKRVKLYTKDTPLFEQFSITDEINKALKSKVWLKSGGYIVINQTEALVAIDVNTGKYVGKTARLEDTIVKTNVDAIKEIVRQIRLRDLGGIIVIDFIDMDERKNRQKVMQALEEALKADRAPSKVLQFNDFGLVAITRKRVKQSLERTLGQPCPTCQATGMIKSVTTVCNEIYVEMRKMSRHFERDIMVRVNPEVGKALKGNGGRWIQEMEDLTKRTILVKSDALLHPEQFDIQ